MRSLSRLVLLCLFAVGLCWPAAAVPARAQAPCPSQTVVKECRPTDRPLAALRALLAADAPCHAKAVAVGPMPSLHLPADSHVAYAAEAARFETVAAESIDPPPRF